MPPAKDAAPSHTEIFAAGMHPPEHMPVLPAQELVLLEFDHYDVHGKQSISGQDFATSLVTAAELGMVDKLLDKVGGAHAGMRHGLPLMMPLAFDDATHRLGLHACCAGGPWPRACTIPKARYSITQHCWLDKALSDPLLLPPSTPTRRPRACRPPWPAPRWVFRTLCW